MPTVIFESQKGDRPPQTVAAPEGGSLADLCDDHETVVPFSCRSASCGTCRVMVLDGAAELLPPNDEELDVLDIFGLSPETHRLACQAQMRPGLATLRVRPVDDDL
jgi:2Fe-2S ferredoxin